MSHRYSRVRGLPAIRKTSGIDSSPASSETSARRTALIEQEKWFLAVGQPEFVTRRVLVHGVLIGHCGSSG